MLTIFLICNILIPYLLYSLTAHHLSWRDRRLKSPLSHASDLFSSVLLGTCLYFLGGYATPAHDAYIPDLLVTATVAVSIIAYGRTSEVHDLQSSLRYFHAWSRLMWSVVAFGICVVVVLTVAHVRYAIGVWGIKVAVVGYLGSFVLLPVFAGLLIYGLALGEWSQDARVRTDEEEEVGTSMLRDLGHHELGGDSEDDDDNDDAETETEERGGRDGGVAPQEGSKGEGEQIAGDGSLRTLPPRPMRSPGSPRPDAIRLRRRKLVIHPHHYQIFGYLAAFTRFPVWYSRLAAGLAMGGMMHGIAAYGVDSVFDFEEE